MIFYSPFSGAKVFLLDHQAFGLFWPSFPLNKSKEPISAYSAEPHWKTSSAEPILSYSHHPNSTTGDIQEATASLCQTGQTHQRMLSSLCLLGAFSRWHVASDPETLLLTHLIRRGALQHRMGYPAQVQAVPWGPTLRLPSFPCLLYRIIGNTTQYHSPKQWCKGLAMHLQLFIFQLMLSTLLEPELAKYPCSAPSWVSSGSSRCLTFRLLSEGKWEQPAKFTRVKFCSYKSRQCCCTCIWLLITCGEKATCPVRW